MEKNHFSHFEERSVMKSFGSLPDGKKAFSITLVNKNGMELTVINYGATISSLKIPTTDGQMTDVVLGFENLQEYIDSFNLESAPYLGAVVGRFAGRIKNAAFKLHDESFQLEKNHGNHQLHGGNFGFSRAFWDIKSINTGDNPSITLGYVSPDGEDGFPGEVSAEVCYKLTEDNQLKVSFRATATKDTVLNLTQHSYFNLEGHTENLQNQMLHVNSDATLELDSDNLPTGILKPVHDTDLDFNTPRNCPDFIDNTFVVPQTNHPAAVLSSEKKRLKLSVFTDQPGVHIYVGGNCFETIAGKENAHYHSNSGICFETQNFPDAPNHDNFPNSILKKEDTYKHETIFKFETF